MYLLRQRIWTINQASKCNPIDKKITWPGWLENKDCVTLGLGFFSLRIWHKLLLFADKNNLQLYPSFEINLAVFIYTRSTLRLVSKSHSILPYPRQKQDKIIFLIHNNSPWQVFGRKTARPFTAIRQQVLLFMILGCWQIFSTGTEEFPTWSKCCDFKKKPVPSGWKQVKRLSQETSWFAVVSSRCQEGSTEQKECGASQRMDTPKQLGCEIGVQGCPCARGCLSVSAVLKTDFSPLLI